MSAEQSSLEQQSLPLPLPPPTSEQQSVPPPKDPSLRGVVGLQNMGNTCYANSTIQLIRAVPELSALIVDDALASKLVDPSNNQAKVLLAYQDLIKTMWGAYRPAYVRPLAFLTEIRNLVKGTVYSNFGIPMQNDSHEYLVWLLDNFHEAMNVNKGKKPTTPPPSPTTNAQQTMAQLAKDGWDTFYSANQSEIVDHCFGMIRQTTECEQCHSQSHQWQPFNVFKISCEGATFDEWIANEFKPDHLEDYACDKCSTRQKAVITRHIWNLPTVLFSSLKRFTPDMRKIMTPPPYDGTDMNFGAYFAPESTHPSRGWLYNLRGIVDHHGSHMGGHYSAQICHPATQEWWWIDDESSSKLTSPRLKLPANYMYLFRAITK